jgi:predicted SAM-dependent methyltransferase
MNTKVRELLKQIPPVVYMVRRYQTCQMRLRQRRLRSHTNVQRQVNAYLESHSVRKLQIGSGATELRGWLNTDYERVAADRVFLDATQPFPIPSQSFDYIFTEHMFEHIDFAQGGFMLEECLRVLKPGGRLRVATPNLQQLLKLFTEPMGPVESDYLRRATERYFPEPRVINACFFLNKFLQTWGHRFVYDPPTLRLAMERAGFRDIVQHAPGESSQPELCNLESHAREIGEDFNRFETMVFEASRPVADRR